MSNEKIFKHNSKEKKSHFIQGRKGMAKFVIECPKCGSVNMASTFILSKKVISCATCGTEIDTKASRLTSKVCPACGKTFVYDQVHSKTNGKGRWTCPACGKSVDGTQLATAHYHMTEVNCPQCACSVEVDETKETAICPVCDYKIDVKNTIAKQKLVSDTGISVIEYEGDNSTFVWKHPIENFNSGSVLIVHESQEAVFFLNGQALDLFGKSGRYVLDTESLPLLKKITALPTEGQEPFHAEVYFINKTVQMGLKWGTDSRIRFIDSKTNLPLDIGASGEMNLVVSDARKLLIKLVGTTGGLSNKQILSSESDRDGVVHKTLQSYFRAPLMTEIKSYLALVMREKQLSVFELDAQMGILSEALRERIAPKFEEYGLTIPEFYITAFSLPSESDPNFKNIKALMSKQYFEVKNEEINTEIAVASRQRQIVEAQTDAQLKMIQAQAEAEVMKATGFAEAEVMRQKGYTQQDVLAADVQKAFAEGIGNMGGGNSSGGGIASDMISMVAGMQLTGNMINQMNSGISSVLSGTQSKPQIEIDVQEDVWTCMCGHAGNRGKFCEECGNPRPVVWTCACGHTGNRGKCCEECGSPRPVSWDCTCGKKGNTGKCCPECGQRKPE